MRQKYTKKKKNNDTQKKIYELVTEVAIASWIATAIFEVFFFFFFFLTVGCLFESHIKFSTYRPTTVSY